MMLLQIQNFYLTEVFHDVIFLLYLTSLLIDMLTGNAVAIYQRKWNSKTGINGTIRHLALFLVMGILLPMITFTTKINAIANGVMVYVIAQYTISILENLSAMGLDIAEPFAKYFEFLNPDEKDKKQINKKGDQDER